MNLHKSDKMQKRLLACKKSIFLRRIIMSLVTIIKFTPEKPDFRGDKLLVSGNHIKRFTVAQDLGNVVRPRFLRTYSSRD